MEIINFVCGNENRFSEFIGKLDGKDKIALISHTDLDGLGAAKVINEVIDADVVKFIGYTDINKNLIQYLKEHEVNKVIFSDLFIKNSEFIKELEKFSEVLIIDHHAIFKDWNSDKTVFLNCGDGFCATYAAYYLFSKIENLEKLDWIVACACVADWCYFKNGKWMSEVYEKYCDNFMADEEGIKKSKYFWSLQWKINLGIIYLRDNLKMAFDSLGEKFGDIGELNEKAAEVQQEFDSYIIKFDKYKEEFAGGYFFEIDSEFEIKSILSSTISSREKDKIFIFGNSDGENYKVSARRQDGGVDLNKFLVEKTKGFENSTAGGHVRAAGANFHVKYLGEFKKRLGILN